MKNEHPDKNETIGLYLPAASKIVEEGRPVSAAEMRTVVAAVDQPDEKRRSAGFYFAGTGPRVSV